MRVLGVDLAWGDGSVRRRANETGVIAADESGRIVDADWTYGVEETVTWMRAWAGPDTVAMIDAPLLVHNPTGMRECEKEVGRRYGRWKVSANSSNLALGWLAGVDVVHVLEAEGWRYDDGRSGPARRGRSLHEVYPYTTLVGAAELGYADARPVYKRRPRRMGAAEFRTHRAANCDELVVRLAALADADPPIDVRSHPVTAWLTSEPSPLADRPSKHREDLIDAVLCAWTGLLWLRHGLARCQVLGADAADDDRDDRHPIATIIAPARPEQRR